MTFFGLKEGQDLENRAAQPHQAFLGVPPPPGTQLINPFNKMGKVKIHTKIADLFLYNPNKGSAQPVSAQTSVPEVPSSISKCNLKSLFRYLFFPCSSKSFYIGIFVKRSSDKEGVGMRLSFVSQNKDLYL